MAANAAEAPGTTGRYDFTATGSDGSNYRLTVIRTTQLGAVTFNGVPATLTVVTEALQKNGVGVYNNSRFEYVEPTSPFKALGTAGNATQESTVTRVVGGVDLPYPATALIGEIGPLPYGDVEIDTTEGREGHFWAVKADTDTTALLCEVIEASLEIASQDAYSTYPRTYCHRVNTLDQVTGHTVTLTYQGEILQFQ
jgi:hypothetical protein